MRETSSEKKKPELKIDSNEEPNQVEKNVTQTRTEPFKEKDSAKQPDRRRVEMQNPLMHESF